MQNDAALSVLSRDELEQLVSIYAKNWLAMDGYWFQAVERKRGMEEAMEHDVAVFEILPHHLTQLAAVPPADC